MGGRRGEGECSRPAEAGASRAAASLAPRCSRGSVVGDRGGRIRDRGACAAHDPEPKARGLPAADRPDRQPACGHVRRRPARVGRGRRHDHRDHGRRRHLDAPVRGAGRHRLARLRRRLARLGGRARRRAPSDGGRGRLVDGGRRARWHVRADRGLRQPGRGMGDRLHREGGRPIDPRHTGANDRRRRDVDVHEARTRRLRLCGGVGGVRGRRVEGAPLDGRRIDLDDGPRRAERCHSVVRRRGAVRRCVVHLGPVHGRRGRRQRGVRGLPEQGRRHDVGSGRGSSARGRIRARLPRRGPARRLPWPLRCGLGRRGGVPGRVPGVRSPARDGAPNAGRRRYLGQAAHRRVRPNRRLVRGPRPRMDDDRGRFPGAGGGHPRHHRRGKDLAGRESPGDPDTRHHAVALELDHSGRPSRRPRRRDLR